MSELARHIESQDGKELREILAGLTPLQHLAAVMIAEHSPPRQVLAACHGQFGEDSVSEGMCWKWSSPVARSAQMDRAIKAVRHYLASSTDERVLDPAWRLRRRRQIIDKAIAGNQLTEARHGLNDVDRMQGMDPSPKQSSGPSVAVQVNTVNNGDYGDLNRPPANDAEYAAWRRQIEIEFGLPPRLPVDQETAKYDGSTDERPPGGNGDGT